MALDTCLPGLAAGLVEQAPGEDGGVVLVGAAVDRVAPEQGVLDILLVDPLGVRVGEEQRMPLHLVLLDLLVQSLHSAPHYCPALNAVGSQKHAKKN